MTTDFTWRFPLPRTHTGMLLGNGTMGVMVWGEGPVLRLTVGRADFWDHRGGMPWREGMSFQAIRTCLEARDEAGLRRRFESTAEAPGEPRRPSVLPVGRFELDFGADAALLDGRLDLATATLHLRLVCGGTVHPVELCLDPGAALLAVRLPAAAPTPAVRRLPAWQWVGEHLQSISFRQPELYAQDDLCGWVQERPVDPPLAVACLVRGHEAYLASDYGDTPEAAVAAVGARLRAAAQAGCATVAGRSAAWWRAYWDRVPRLTLANDRLDFLYRYGMYKFAGLTHPDGVAATLQGPWVEEYQMPPWSNDYHFNINVQMCYWPAYHGNRLEHLGPLVKLLQGWLPIMRENARVFLGIDDGLMLPHAVDDRCTCMGGFWTGSVDHGCTAWVAQMLFRQYRYGRDRAFLREVAWPFMVGAMRVYEGMLERAADGSWALPVSVSPEYRGASFDAWGRNASFQLACVHRLLEDLGAAAAILGETPRPVWADIGTGLPRACLLPAGAGAPADARIIGLWEGTPLEESHRHHSHLAGLVPFDTLDLDDPAWDTIVRESLDQWILRGPALWSGWCTPWAAMLHGHLGSGAASEWLLETWQRVFTNEGHGTLHDGDLPGFTLFSQHYSRRHGRRSKDQEIMQMDAGMAATTAIQQMCLHERRGVTRIFPAVPPAWREAAFTGMLTDGGHLVSARREEGRTVEVEITSPLGGVLCIESPWGDGARVSRSGGVGERCAGPVLHLATAPGERLRLTRG